MPLERPSLVLPVVAGGDCDDGHHPRRFSQAQLAGPWPDGDHQVGVAQALCRVRTFAAQTPRIPRPPTCRVPSYLGLVNKACVTMRAARMGSQGPRRDVHVCFAFVCGLSITRNAYASTALTVFGLWLPSSWCFVSSSIHRSVWWGVLVACQRCTERICIFHIIHRDTTTDRDRRLND